MTDQTTRIILITLAQTFDQQHADRAKLADEMLQSEDQGFAEQDAIARTWENAANVTWELCGGRPDGQFADRHHKVRIDARELAKLIELATSAKHVETDAEFAETNRVLTNSAQRIQELTKERDNAIERLGRIKAAHDALRNGVMAFVSEEKACVTEAMYNEFDDLNKAHWQVEMDEHREEINGLRKLLKDTKGGG